MDSDSKRFFVFASILSSSLVFVFFGLPQIPYNLWYPPKIQEAQGITCGFGTDIGGGVCRGFVLSGTTWTVPTDWNSASNTIEVIGGGGGGCGHAINSGNGGGGGGAYAKIINLTLTPSASVNIQVGAAGAFRGSGTATWFNGTTCGGASVCGDFGVGSVNATGGLGGITANSVGTTKYKGGDGGDGNTAADSQGGGGGGAGPNGAGGNGGFGDDDNTTDGVGGGGGGNGGGSAGGDGRVSDTVGANGGNNFSGSGGGAGGNPGAAGTAGGGGGGGDDAAAGGNGGDGQDWDATHGSGGGGGGGGDSAGGGNGGLYGAGGGGGIGNNPIGAQGIIVITYTPVLVTIADGTDPSNSTVAPGSSIIDLDAFVLSTNIGTDSVTALTVNLAGGTATSVSEVRITSSDGSTTYFSAVSNPISDTINFSGGTPIPVTTTPTTYKVRITPKTHANMPIPPGSSYAVSGTTTSFTTSSTQAGSDTDSAIITVDNASPSGATVTSGTAGSTKVTLNWTTSASSDYSRSIILRWAAATPGAEVPAEGTDYSVDNTITTATVACVETTGTASFAESGVDGTGTGGCSATPLSNGQQYSYKVFQKDSNGNYDLGVTFTGSPFTPANALPIASGVSIDSGAGSITLTEDTTKTVSCSGTVTDTDGFGDISSVTADLYRTPVGTSSALSNNDHYRLSGDANCVPSGGSGNSETYTCDFSVQYYADPTDAGAPFSAQDWTCMMTPVDSVATGTPASDTIEMASLLAINIVSGNPINYGSLDPDTNSGVTNQTLTIRNTGNRDEDPELSGVNLTSGGNSILVSQQEYSATPFTYTAGTDLTGSAVGLNITLPQGTSGTVPIEDDIFWGIGIPSGTTQGTYVGTTTITATIGL